MYCAGYTVWTFDCGLWGILVHCTAGTQVWSWLITDWMGSCDRNSDGDIWPHWGGWSLLLIPLYLQFFLQARRDNLLPDNMLVGSFNDTIATIENYHHTSEFNGSLEMFFALVEKCLPYRPVRSSYHLVISEINVWVCVIIGPLYLHHVLLYLL